MIQRTLLQGLVLILSFVAVWFALSQVDFVKFFNIEQTSANTEEKLGDLLWEAIQKTETIIHDKEIVKPIDSLVSHLTEKNGIDRESIKLHIVQKDEINAFAMPGNHLVLYTGLIADCENESELAGVIGHEIAHIEKNHVMKKLVKEVGLSVLISMATGGRSSQTVQQTVKLLSSSAYDRRLETEADMTSVDYLVKANLDANEFANFMFKMGMNNDAPDAFYYVNTHPDSEERAKAIIEDTKDRKYVKKLFLSANQWKSLKENVSKIKN